MQFIYKILLIYWVLVSLISIIVCVWDKHRAKKRGWRVRESTLLILSAIGGGIAMYFTMRIIHHKTLHNKFMVGIPVIIFLQIAVLLFILYEFF